MEFHAVVVRPILAVAGVETGQEGVGATVSEDDWTGKLVRDHVPDIIRTTGSEPITRIADAEEYSYALLAKLQEECLEFFLARDKNARVAELVDILEVAYAIAADLGVSAGRLDLMRAAKAADRGTFTKRVIWGGNLS